MKPASKQKAKVYREEWPRVRKGKIKGEIWYVVDARRAGTSAKREFLPTIKAALDRAREIAAAYLAEGVEGVELNSQLRVDAVRAWHILQPLGVSLVESALHYKTWRQSQLAIENSRYIKDLAEEWFAHKKAGATRKLRDDSIKGIRKGANFLIKHFGENRILAVTVNDIQKVLDSLNVTNRTKYNLSRIMSQFFNWCRKPQRGYCTDNPCDGYECDPNDPDKEEAEIASPELVKRMMLLCEEKYPSLIIYHAVCFFGGLRPHAAQKLTGENILLDRGFLKVRKMTVKTKESFEVPIERNLRVWLETYWDKNNKGLIIPEKNFPNLIKQYRKDLGYRITTYKQVKGRRVKEVSGEKKYPPDLTRHSYGSYWLALHNQRGQLAENMNTSVEIIKRHYKATVDPKAALEFWSIAPKGQTAPVPIQYPTYLVTTHGLVQE